MCGLAGWIDLKKDAAGMSVLTSMTDAIAHRGPDGSGALCVETRDGRYSIALGHRRLAIIDLVGGTQPMVSADRQITLVFNGEIYNFQSLRDELRAQGFIFSTNSDTEVLLNAWRAWGIDCLRRLRGMFAFALWDAGRETLLMARDRFGKKPIFFHQREHRLLFASEIKALLKHPGVEIKQDKFSALDYLQYRYVPAPATMFEGITKLMPGSYALWQNGHLTQAPYATVSDADAPPPLTSDGRDNPVHGFMKILDDAVRLRMISDAPFGAFLSGGLDSSAIVALMSHHSERPINTFSVGFQESAFDETSYAKIVATRFKTNHHEWHMNAHDIIALLPEAIRFRDAPISEPTDVAVMVLSRLASKSVKMVLTGEGADEILAGYPKHKYEAWAAVYQKFVPLTLHHRLIEPIIDALPGRFYRMRTAIHSLGLRDPHERLPRWFGSLGLSERDALVSEKLPTRQVSEFAFGCMPSVTPLRKCLVFDQNSWLPDNLLERGDRMTMAGSIEARMPFMDHELAFYMSTLSDNFRIRGNVQKYILRCAMSHTLPTEILARRKIGFRVPVSIWFRTTLKDFVYDHLLGQNSCTGSLYRKDVLQKILDQHATDQINHEKLIWSLVSFELFQKEYGLHW